MKRVALAAVFLLTTGVQVVLADAGEADRLATLGGAGGRSICFSNDGRWVVTAGDSAVQVWDGRTYAPRGSRITLIEGIQFARFDAAAEKLLVLRSVRADRKGIPGLKTTSGEARVAEARTGTILPTAFRHGDLPVADADISPDGSLVVTCNEEADTVLVWDVATGKQRASLKHERPALGVRFSPSGTTLLTTTRQANTLWDVATWRRRVELPGKEVTFHGDPPGAAFSADGSRVAIIKDATFEVYDVANGHKVSDNQPDALHLDMVMSNVSISADGRRVGTASTDGGAVWDAATGRRLLRGEEGPLTIAPALNRDGSLAVIEAVSSESVVHVAAAKCVLLPRRDDLNPSVACFSPAGDRLAIGTFGGDTVIYPAE